MSTIAQPPYTPVFDFDGTWQSITDFFSQLDFENYTLLTEDPLYWKAYLSSLQIAAISTVLLLIVGYPIAYGMARAPRTLRPTLLMLVILPFWTSFLIRVYAWIGILKPEGLLNLALSKIGLVDMAQPARRSSTPTGRSISASSTPTCPSWCCRSTRRWRRWTRRCSRRRQTSAASRSRPSGW